MPSRKRESPCKSPPRRRESRPQPERPPRRLRDKVAETHDMMEIQKHYKALENSKLGVLAHVASQHSVLDVLYGGDTGRPMPSWTYQTTPEVGVLDQQHTGRCWIFATLSVLGHVFRSQYGISNSRATFSEGYLGFWDLYEKSRLFLQVAYDTRCTPLDDPSLSDLLKGGISDGGDYIFCLNLLDRYGVVPTEYYPNTTYGSMSTEALVTLMNQVLRDNAITLRTTGNEELINPMLTNIFSILCMGLGTPPAPWKKLDWQLDQCETTASFAVELPPSHVAAASIPVQQVAVANLMAASTEPQGSATLPEETVPWRQAAKPPNVEYSRPAPAPAPTTLASLSVPRVASAPMKMEEDPTYPIEIPPKPAQPSPPDTTLDELVAALNGPTTPPSPVESTATARPLPEDEKDYPIEASEDAFPSTTSVVPELDATGMISSEPQLTATLPPRRVIDIPSKSSSRNCLDLGGAGDCKRPGGFSRVIQKLTPSGCQERAIPKEGAGDFFMETMPDSDRLLGRMPSRACRLSHTICAKTETSRKEDALSFDYTPRDFYYRFLNSVRFVPVVCDARFPSGTRIISNDANMYGGLPSLYLNIGVDDMVAYTIASLKRNIPVWFACDVKKQLTPEGGRMCTHTDRLSELLPEPHLRGTKLQQIRHFNAIANHALLISAVSMKGSKPVAWRIVNSWGEIGRNAGIFVACNDWFREHVYSINVVYDTLKKEHKADVDMELERPTVRLGPFDPSVI